MISQKVLIFFISVAWVAAVPINLCVTSSIIDLCDAAANSSCKGAVTYTPDGWTNGSMACTIRADVNITCTLNAPPWNCGTPTSSLPPCLIVTNNASLVLRGCFLVGFGVHVVQSPMTSITLENVTIDGRVSVNGSRQLVIMKSTLRNGAAFDDGDVSDSTFANCSGGAVSSQNVRELSVLNTSVHGATDGACFQFNRSGTVTVALRALHGCGADGNTALLTAVDTDIRSDGAHLFLSVAAFHTRWDVVGGASFRNATPEPSVASVLRMRSG